jgi:NADH-quinone oxidoreductase subunit M
MLTLTLILLPIIAGLLTLSTKGENAKVIALVAALVELALGAYTFCFCTRRYQPVWRIV